MENLKLGHLIPVVCNVETAITYLYRRHIKEYFEEVVGRYPFLLSHTLVSVIIEISEYDGRTLKFYTRDNNDILHVTKHGEFSGLWTLPDWTPYSELNRILNSRDKYIKYL